MKNFTKFLAVILCMVIALSTAACSLTPQWSYKEGDNELAIGVYIYALYNAYSEAQALAQETEGYDSEKNTYNGEESFLKVQITDEEGVTATADQWITDKADKTMRTLLAVDKEYERLGATMDQTTEDGYKASAKEYWDYGPYYAMYGEQYINPYKDIFEPLGISYESFEYFYITSAKQEFIFDLIYGEGCEKEVGDEELTKFFTDNYTSYTYFNSNLYETEQTETDENGGALSTNKALPEEDVKKYEASYKGYADALNSGDKLADVIEKFKKDFELESDPSVSNVEIMEESTIGEDLVKAINELKEGEASYKTVGEKDSQVIYLFYKEPIKNQVKNYIEDDANRTSVLYSYKGEEFKSYIDDLALSIDVEINKAVNKYSPSMFEE